MKKYCFFVVFLVFLVFLLLYLSMWWNSLPQQTKHYYDKTESHYSSKQHQTILKEKKVVYLFWTGGFDSTYRLIELVLDKQYIQPIYLMSPNLDSQGQFQRKNRKEEIGAMKHIRHRLYQQFPYSRKYILPTRYVYQIYEDPVIHQHYNDITVKKLKFKRSISQYERITQYSYRHPYPIEVGLEKCGTGLDKISQNYRKGTGYGCQIDYQKAPRNYYIFQHIRFPICHLTKEDMIQKSTQNNTLSILELTWSCWFPKNGKPCGQCDMCQHRILK